MQINRTLQKNPEDVMFTCSKDWEIEAILTYPGLVKFNDKQNRSNNKVNKNTIT